MKGVLVVVPCGKAKIWDRGPDRGSMPARHAYTGPPFKVNMKYAQHFAEQWVILSAKYGLIPPDFIIPGPYNVTFKDKSTNPVSVSTLREQIQVQNLGCFEVVIGLGGKDYRDAVRRAFVSFPAKVCFPFAGLIIGKAMKAISQAIELGEPCPKLEM